MDVDAASVSTIAGSMSPQTVGCCHQSSCVCVLGPVPTAPSRRPSHLSSLTGAAVALQTPWMVGVWLPLLPPSASSEHTGIGGGEDHSHSRNTVGKGMVLTD